MPVSPDTVDKYTHKFFPPQQNICMAGHIAQGKQIDMLLYSHFIWHDPFQ